MDSEKHFPYLIIGAGPAGLQMAYTLGKQGDRYLVLERSEQPGNFFATFPRHRKLLSINKVFTGCQDLDSRLRYDWNSLLSDDEELLFSRYSRDYFPNASDLQRYLADFASRHRLNVRCGANVARVAKPQDRFEVQLEDGSALTCDRLLVATGLFKPNLPVIQGLELCEHYVDFSVDPAEFADQKVMIIGKGNSAFETAEALTAVTRKIQVCGPNYVRLAWVSHFVGDVRAINNNFLDTYHLKGQNNILDGEPIRVSRRDDGQLAVDVYFASRRCTLTYECDRVLLCTGFRFDGSIFDPSCQPDLAYGGALPAMTSEWESTNIRDLYFLGTLMQMRDRKKTMSSFIHGFRHNLAALDQMFDRKYRGKDWQQVSEIPLEPKALADKVIERVSTAPAMFLQPGFLCDLLSISREENRAFYYEDMPRDYIRDTEGSRHDDFDVISLEYGHVDGYHDPFAMPRGVGVVEDFYLHPILRRFEGGAEAGQFFLPDDLDNDWRLIPSNREALEQYFAERLSGRAPSAQLSGRSYGIMTDASTDGR